MAGALKRETPARPSLRLSSVTHFLSDRASDSFQFSVFCARMLGGCTGVAMPF
jgi:hypothetical protein